MRLLHQDQPLHHHHHHRHHHHHHHHQQEEELLQQQQADQQELQRQRILSLFKSSPPPPEPSEDPLPDLQPALSFDLFPIPRQGEAPGAVEAASHDFAGGGSGAEVGSQAIVGAGAGVGADVQVRKRRGRPPRLNGGGCGSVASSVTGRREDEEEDVCFICFDGGTLVLCDRR